MSNHSTIARPYAKAAFEYARDTNSFDQWSNGLTVLATIAADPLVISLLSNPKLSREQRAQLFIDTAGNDLDQSLTSFARLLANYDRLMVLPQLAEQFEQLRAEVESAVDGELLCAQAIDDKQQQAISAALSKRLNKTVKLHCVIDESLIGGVKIKVGDWVMDGSIRGRLEKMASSLNN